MAPAAVMQTAMNASCQAHEEPSASRQASRHASPHDSRGDGATNAVALAPVVDEIELFENAIHRSDERAAGGITHRGVAGERPADDAGYLLGNLRANRPHIWRRSHLALLHRLLRRATEWWLPCQHLEYHQAERIEIAPPPLAASDRRLLGTHVRRRARHGAR